MTLVLTPEELDEVKRKQKDDIDLPLYFNSGTEQFQAISRDFESFLILSKPSVLNSAKEWLSNVTELNKKNAERDSILNSAFDFEREDAIDTQSEALTWIATFEEFKKNFRVDNKFSDVVEVGFIMQDLEFFVGEHQINEERFNHLDILNDILQIKHQKDQTTPELQKQLDSWSQPLSAFL